MPARTNHQTSQNRDGNRIAGGPFGRLVGEEMNESTDKQPPIAEPDITGHLGNLGADLLTLGELQLELLSVDARDAAKGSYVPTVFACLGLGFVMGACPLALLGLSWWLTDVTSLTLATSSLLVALAGLLIAGVFLYLAWKGFRLSMGMLGRSRTEFRSNLRWIKQLLSQKQPRWPF